MRLKLLIILSMLTYNSQAQNKPDITGSYSSSGDRAPEGNAKLFVLPEHTFVVPYFGGVLMGKWSWDKEGVVVFEPSYYPHRYAVWSRYNKDLGDSMRIYFRDFNEEENFIAFGTPGNNLNMQRVFNVSPNCVPYPSVYKFSTVANTINFSDIPYGSDTRNNSDVYSFINNQQHNDFVAFYFRRKQDNRPFYAKMEQGKLRFATERRGNEFNFKDHYFDHKTPLPQDGENRQFIEQVAAMVGKDIDDTLLYNQYYKDCVMETYDTLNYRYDSTKDAYISVYNYEEGEEYRPMGDNYNRCFILYPFRLMKKFTSAKREFTIKEQPLFHFTCDDRQ